MTFPWRFSSASAFSPYSTRDALSASHILLVVGSAKLLTRDHRFEGEVVRKHHGIELPPLPYARRNRTKSTISHTDRTRVDTDVFQTKRKKMNVAPCSRRTGSWVRAPAATTHCTTLPQPCDAQHDTSSPEQDQAKGLQRGTQDASQATPTLAVPAPAAPAPYQ